MREDITPGRYGDQHLAVLAKSLRWVERELDFSKKELAENLLFSPKVISSVMAEFRPKLDNFLRLTNNLIALLEDWVSDHPEIPPVFERGASEWRVLKSSATKKIARLSKELGELLDIVRRSNSLAMNDAVMTPELKEQLIALLETALAQLRSPIVETKLFGKTGRWLKKLAKKFGGEAGNKALEKLASDAGEHVIDLIESSMG